MTDIVQETLQKLYTDKQKNLEIFLLEIFGDEEKARVIGAYYTLEEKAEFREIAGEDKNPRIHLAVSTRLSLKSEQELNLSGITEPVHVTWQRYLENGE